MPTRRSRISVVRDPDLGSALETSRDQLTAQTEAGRLRELAIIGARSLESGPHHDGSSPGAREILLGFGASPEQGDLVVTGRRLVARRASMIPGTPESAAESLEWVRGQR